jgi:hypothetical protein
LERLVSRSRSIYCRRTRKPKVDIAEKEENQVDGEIACEQIDILSFLVQIKATSTSRKIIFKWNETFIFDVEKFTLEEREVRLTFFPVDINQAAKTRLQL